jgi:2-dehydro-3-deoxyphosphogluconate aldolase/(4S)-4-hydroxy-2-oxoglutarate aldolase
MPHSKIMVTGGVEPTYESMKTWFDAGASVVGMGSQLFPPALIAQQDYKGLSNKISDLIQIYRSF